MSVVNDVFVQALSLPAADRKALAIQLLDSLPEEESPIELDPEYVADVYRRLEEIDSGRARMLSLEEVMTSLRKPSSSGAAP
jgi:putative addiction module component (TIGR02574 family)